MIKSFSVSNFLATTLIDSIVGRVKTPNNGSSNTVDMLPAAASVLGHACPVKPTLLESLHFSGELERPALTALCICLTASFPFQLTP